MLREAKPMDKIKIERAPVKDRLEQLGVFHWPIWTKEASEFFWYYDASETCYFLAGEVVVTTVDGQQVEVGQGDLVTFPAGLHCTWKVIQPVRKHYNFD
jgi:uncharacterized cupin superfamily protein